MNVQLRLKEERARLVLTQDAFAEVAGVSKRALANYEAGERKPDSDFLAAIAAAGADVLYILTGQRTPASAATMQAPPPTPVLTADEAELLAWYRDSHPAVQRSIKAALKEAAPQTTDPADSAPKRARGRPRKTG